MAGGRKPQEDSLSSQIREVFQADHSLLEGRSNDDVRSRWKEKHKKALPSNFDSVMANVKSTLRQKLGIKTKKGRKKGKKTALAAVGMAMPVAPGGIDKKLVFLGDHIDDCYAHARGMGRADLEEVVKMLKRARNRVVVMAGE